MNSDKRSSARGQAAWIRSTDQGWKVVVFVLLLLTAGAGLGLLVVLLSIESLPDIAVTTVGLGSGVIGCTALLWLVLSIHCRSCGGRPVWGMLNSADASSWWPRLITTKGCPICGDRGQS